MNPSIRLLTARRIFTHPLRNSSIFNPVRTYATTQVKGAKPPITIHTLEGTYASALYSSSSQNNATLNDIEKSLSTIRQRVNSDVKLQHLLANPALSQVQRREAVKALTEVGGGSADARKAVKNLLEIMTENGRLSHLAGVAGAFERIMRAHKGEIEVVVTSSQPLDSKVLGRLEQSISKSPLIQKGQKVRMENKVNETILGGLIVEIGDRTIDLSVQSRISKLNQLLYETL